MPPGKSSAPASWAEACSAAASDLAGALGAPDADIRFGLAMIGALSAHARKGPQSGSLGAGTAAGPPGGGVSGSPSPGGSPAGPPSGGPMPGPAGGGAPNSAMPNVAAPGGPIPGGMTNGLTPNPDELRRTLSDVAGQ